MNTQMTYQRQTAPYSHCQLVTAFNALIFYGKSAPRQHGKRFERLIDLIYARNGSALAVSRAHHELGLKTVTIPHNIRAIKRHLDRGRPVEIHITRDWAGFHSVLIVGYQDGHYLVTNWNQHEAVSRVTSRELRKGEGLNSVRGWCYFVLDTPHPNAYHPCPGWLCAGWLLVNQECDCRGNKSRKKSTDTKPKVGEQCPSHGEK